VSPAQVNLFAGLLREIRDRLPVPQIPEEPVTVRRMDGSRMTVGTPGPRKGSEMAADKRQALAIVRAVLDDWIKGARENHEAMGHRAEPVGSECWRSFHPQDIRNMINDAARELGLTEFPTVPEHQAEENKR
jgi:hypothetical protein